MTKILDWRRYPNFTPEEMACKDHCHACEMDADFMMMLQSLRSAIQIPLVITSGYRCDAHNTAIGGGPAHPLGRAADIAISRGDAYSLTKLALLHGFTGVGWKQHGETRFVHLDNLTAKETVVRPTIWSYP